MIRDVRAGDRLFAFDARRGCEVPVTVTDPVFHDPQNARRDGDPPDVRLEPVRGTARGARWRGSAAGSPRRALAGR
nr:hypothetical protein GCM10020093_104870 [Planobispora longispora]